MARILFAEDDALIRKTLQPALLRAGYEVTAAEDGDRALALLDSAAWDLALFDVKMPGCSGMEVGRAFRVRHAAVPLIFLTAYENDEFLREAVELDAYAYLVKPLGSNQLLPLIETALAAADAARDKSAAMEQALLNSREISAAAGILAERHAWSIDVAFGALKTLARSRRRKITEVAAEVIASLPVGRR